jgi:sugar/nucleoside kinase (ribokinase family)
MSRDTRWDVVGVGCNSVDNVYRAATLPIPDTPSAKQRLSRHERMCGGQMATAVAACATFGLRAAYIGAVGHDDNGRRILDELRTRGVDVSGVTTRACDNRFAVITVDDATGDRTILWDRDARLNLQPGEIDPHVIQSTKLLHIDDEDEGAALIAARVARSNDVIVTSDLDRVTPHTRELLSLVTIPIFAQHILSELTGVSQAEEALRRVAAPHHQMVCVTRGAAGALMLIDGELLHEPAVAVTAVDTTGAGDLFRAGFIYALLKGEPPRTILRVANAAAAVSCTRAGAMASIPSLAEVQQLAMQ